MRPAQDPATLEIVRHALGSVADEMAIIIARTAYSATVRDAWPDTLRMHAEGRSIHPPTTSGA